MTSHRLGFVSTRFAGTDGVSLESAKWAQLLWDHSHYSYWYAGVLDRDPNVSMHVPEAYFYHADNVAINDEVFGRRQRSRDATKKIYAMAELLKETLYDFVDKFGVEILVVQNALCLPMHIPLGLALTHLIAETEIPTIAHHHDFYWERARYSVNAVGDFLTMAFPPALPSIQHATINTAGQQELAWRKGESSILVPNVLDFENPPPQTDQFSEDFREAIGIAPDDILFLQPTRVVPRKGIEHAIALVSQLKSPKCKLVVTHASGDEGLEYQDALTDLAADHGVDLRFVHTQVGEFRSTGPDGQKVYSLWDVYPHADVVTYPSLYEGFGNALLEAFYFRKPVLVNRYSIFVADIEPKGFRVITMDGYITRKVIEQVNRVIEDSQFRDDMVNHNYELGKAFFSYSVLRRKLGSMVRNVTGTEAF